METKQTDKKVTMVQVPKEKLEALLDRVDRLEYAASKAYLDNYDAKRGREVGTTARVSTYEGKIVIGWELIENLVERNPQTGVWMERQTIRVETLGNEPEEMPYVQFVRRIEYKEVERLSKTVREDGREIWKVRTQETGLTEPVELDIDVRFLN